MSGSSEDTDLASWLKRIGGAVHAGVQLPHQLPSGGRGALASANCRRGAALISVPAAGCLHVASDPLTAEHEVRQYSCQQSCIR